MDSSKIDEFLASQGAEITTLVPDEYLEHFGVKGMHWGVRKAGDHENGSGGSIKESAKGHARAATSAAGASAKKNAHAHVGLTSAAAGIGAAVVTSRVTGRPILGVAAGVGTAYGVHHKLTHPADLEQHVDRGKTFVSNHPAVKK